MRARSRAKGHATIKRAPPLTALTAQILTLGAARLEPARPLSAYGLPVDGDAGRVFLYSR